MRPIPTNKGTRLFWFLMALHILNLSVDPIDPQPIHVPENLGYNEMESIVEIVLELVLNIENAIPEQEDDDTNKGLLSSNSFKLDYYQPNLSLDIHGEMDITVKHRLYAYHGPFSGQFHPEVVPPPPRV